ncbi:pyridoxamine 5'-phosphate oxidase family protein [Streptomyces sp. NBC_01477]|uniref:pyridoxamine 5'-phosphate oxidase family protein n=1 Tax=Streptomyces sp. NBC_01477 TaxID=2976015 RepID=UPI002E2EBD68|nr:pyridoxamine 5'-phosphate oxidase family protein [Streptomyces sp. NBC_01477]
MTQNDQPAGPRSRAERKLNALRLLANELDVWVATADASGVPTLMPLTYLWDGEAVWLSTRPTNPTGANLAASGTVRLCLGTTRDVVHIEGAVTAYTADELPDGVGDAFAAKDGWDPRKEPDRYDFYRVAPTALRAWGTVPELKDRLLLNHGTWLL